MNAFVSTADMLRADGKAEGIGLGLEQGLERGLEQGLEQGELIGRIQAFQRFLKIGVSSRQELQRLSLPNLEQMTLELEGRLPSS